MQAIDLILEPPEHDGKYMHDYDLFLARVEWKSTRNAASAVSKIKRSIHTIEGQLLQSLKKFGNDLVGALNTVRNTSTKDSAQPHSASFIHSKETSLPNV